MDSNLPPKNRNNTLYWTAAGIGSVGLAWFLYSNIRSAPDSANPKIPNKKSSFNAASQRRSFRYFDWYPAV